MAQGVRRPLEDGLRGGPNADRRARRTRDPKPSINPPYYGFFETKDGYIVIAAGGRGLQVRVAKLLGIDDPALTDPNFQIDDIGAYTRRMRRRSAARLAEETTSNWLEKFDAAGLPAGEYRLKDEIFEDPHVWENGYLTRLEHEEVGGMTVVAPPVRFSETPLSTTTASPGLASTRGKCSPNRVCRRRRSTP